MPSWNTDIAAPLATANFTLEKFLSGDSLLHSNSDSSISIVQEIPLTGINFDTLIKFGVIPFKETYNLQSLKLQSNNAVRRFSLGELLKDNPLEGFFQNGQPLPAFIIASLPPTLELGPVGPLEYDASNLLESATLLTGSLTVSIKNELPVNVTNATVIFQNAVDKSIILQKNNIQIPINQSTSFTEDLAGKTIKSAMEIIITTMQVGTDSLKTAIIDTSKALTVSLNLSNVTVSEATAIFPAQNVIEEKSNIPFEGLGKMQIKNAKLKSGKVKIEVVSTAQDTLFFDYIIPSITENGVPFSTKEKVLPATPTQAAHYFKEFDFTNWDLDLSLKNQGKDTVNTFRSELTGRINYTGKKIYLSLKDSMAINLTMENLVAEEANGYLGDTTITFSGSQTISNLAGFQNAKLHLNKTKVLLSINNGLGAEGNLTINKFEGENTTSNQKLNLAGTVLQSPFQVNAATNPPFKSVESVLNISETNSNINEIISLLPNKVNYSVAISLNPSGNVVYTNFLKKESEINAVALLETPLSLKIEDWQIFDTTSLDLSILLQLNNVENGALNLFVYNGFPFEITPTLYLLNDEYSLLTTLSTTDKALASNIDSNGKTTSEVKSTLKFVLNNVQIEALKKAKYLAIKIKIASSPTTFVKLYSNYGLKLNLGGEFNYNIQK